MKTIKLTALLLIFPLTFYAQSLTGLWSGTLTNDSSTIRKDQSFEIVLTQYKDKVYGYSRMTFFVHDTLYYIVKRVKGSVEGDICEVKDDDIISHNFPRKPDKGVKLVSTFRRNQQDSLWSLDGDWKTTETKKHRYYSISGSIALKTETDLEKSKLIPHLEELKLAEDVAFYKEAKKAEQESIVAAKQITERNKTGVTAQKQPATSFKEEVRKDEVVKIPVKSEPVVQVRQIVKEEKNQPATTPVAVANENKKEEVVKTPVRSEPVVQAKQIVKEEKKESVIPAVVITNENKKEELAKTAVKSEPVTEVKQTVAPVKSVPQKTEPVVITKPVETGKEVGGTNTKSEIKKPVEPTATVVKEKPQPITNTTVTNPSNVTNVTTPKLVLPQAATFVAERKVAAPQTVFFRSDSLELTLYDNGEVDGDTVSVLLNGDLILAKQGLKTTAIRKTIYVPAGKTDSLTLVLYAENLGKYPPNTGLLVIHDGDDVYQVRFSADLKQNAAVIFKRKQN